MKEIVSPAQAEAIVRGVAAALVGVGAAAGVIAAIFVRPRRIALTFGALVVGAGVLVFGLWMVYNAIIARLGLDSVKGLLINLGIFLVVGVLYGVAAARAWRRALLPHGD